MNDHLHTGFLQLFIGAMATIVIIHAIRMTATYLASQENAAAQSAGKVLGGVVTFS
jgi:hypothetical protein